MRRADSVDNRPESPPEIGDAVLPSNESLGYYRSSLTGLGQVAA
ncbi:MAG: hypothetical protein R3B96_01635 [Pirellulaceae bacterium]